MRLSRPLTLAVVGSAALLGCSAWQPAPELADGPPEKHCYDSHERAEVQGLTLAIHDRHCFEYSVPAARLGTTGLDVHYEYHAYEISSDDLTVFASTHAGAPELYLAHIQLGDTRRLLSPKDFERPILVATLEYFRERGWFNPLWLDPEHGDLAYSPVPERVGQ